MNPTSLVVKLFYQTQPRNELSKYRFYSSFNLYGINQLMIYYTHNNRVKRHNVCKRHVTINNATKFGAGVPYLSHWLHLGRLGITKGMATRSRWVLYKMVHARCVTPVVHPPLRTQCTKISRHLFALQRNATATKIWSLKKLRIVWAK